MEEYRLESAKVVGTATEKSWSQIHLFSPTDKEKKHLRGELLAVLSLNGLGDGIEAVTAGREIISRLHEEYYGNLEGTAFERLSQTVQKICSESNEETKIEIGAAVVIDKVLYLVIKGDGKIVLQREGKVGILLAGDEKLTTASGFLQDNDLFLLGTAGFFQNLPMGVLKASLTSGSPSLVAEAIAPIIHGQAESGTKAAIIFKTTKTTPEETLVPETTIVPPPITPSPPVSADKGKFSLPGQGRSLNQLVSLVKFKVNNRLTTSLVSIQKRLRQKTIYLKKESLASEVSPRIGKKPERSKKTIFTIVIVLLAILGLSVGLGARQRKQQADKQGITSLLETARQKKQEGESQLSLNPTKARQLLLEAEGLVSQIDAKKYTDSEFNQFKQELDNLLASVVKEYSIEAKTFYDLGLLRSGAKGNDWAFSGEKLIVLDKQQPSVYEIGTNDNKAIILTGGKNLTDSYRITAFLPKIFTLTNSGIIETDKITKKEKMVVESNNEGQIIDLATFAGNLYLLTPEGEIWQYLAGETGFGPQQTWLKGENKSELIGAISLTIDGSIWVLKTDGTVLKFTRGRKENFNLEQLDQQIKIPFPSKPVAIYTNDDSENLYFFDQGIPGVIIFNKAGEYQAAYTLTNPSSETSQIKNLAVDEKGKKIYLLGESKIFEIEMK